jgi:uncharacterized protein
MPEFFATLTAAGLLGLLGAGHCFAMCGGIVAALSFTVPENTSRWRLNLGYNAGRILSYGLFGGLAAGMTSVLSPGVWPWARTLAGVLLIAMGLYLANWWRGLLWLERGGHWIWRRLKPWGDQFLPIDSARKALAVGLVWGWLPCGLVYAALMYAAVQADAIKGAAVMLVFGAGTLPALLAGGALATALKKGLGWPGVRLVLALAYVVFGIWTLASAWSHALHQGSGQVQHHHH